MVLSLRFRGAVRTPGYVGQAWGPETAAASWRNVAGVAPSTSSGSGVGQSTRKTALAELFTQVLGLWVPWTRGGTAFGLK